MKRDIEILQAIIDDVEGVKQLREPKRRGLSSKYQMDSTAFSRLIRGLRDGGFITKRPYKKSQCEVDKIKRDFELVDEAIREMLLKRDELLKQLM